MSYSKESRNIKVLMYHRIVKDRSDALDDEHAVSKHNFQRQLQLLERFNFTPITFEDFQFFLEDKLTLPKKPIILTFDDGHRETYEVARPLLQEFNMRAVMYVMGDRSLKYAAWDEEKRGERLPLMTDCQIREIRSEGFEIGAHSMTHPRLGNLSKDEIEQEIIGSKRAIEMMLDEKILSFSYPYGVIEEPAYSVVESSGFKFACGVFNGPPRFGDDWFNIRRLAVKQNTSMTRFLAKVLLPYEYMMWIYNRFKKKVKIQKAIRKAIGISKINFEKILKNKRSQS